MGLTIDSLKPESGNNNGVNINRKCFVNKDLPAEVTGVAIYLATIYTVSLKWV